MKVKIDRVVDQAVGSMSDSEMLAMTLAMIDRCGWMRVILAAMSKPLSSLMTTGHVSASADAAAFEEEYEKAVELLPFHAISLLNLAAGKHIADSAASGGAIHPLTRRNLRGMVVTAAELFRDEVTSIPDLVRKTLDRHGIDHRGMDLDHELHRMRMQELEDADSVTDLELPIGLVQLAKAAVSWQLGSAWYQNSAGADAVTSEHLNQVCYVGDDHTVHVGDGYGTGVRAGILEAKGTDVQKKWLGILDSLRDLLECSSRSPEEMVLEALRRNGMLLPDIDRLRQEMVKIDTEASIWCC